MGRPPMPVGTYGKINTTPTGDGRFVAFCRFRDYDGTVRPVQRIGKTRRAAQDALKEALRDRKPPTGGDLTRDSKVSDLAAEWLREISADDELSIDTKQAYRRAVRNHVAPSIGQLRLSEATVAALDRALADIRTRRGPSAAKTAKAVMSGMFGLATRRGSLSANPVRDTSRIKVTRNRPKALTAAETDDILGSLYGMERAVELDLPELADLMLGTGCRIGEACAMRDGTNSEGEPLLDLEHGTWEIDATVIRIDGGRRRKLLEAKPKLTWLEEEELVALLRWPAGLHVQQRPKTAAGWRRVALPPQNVAMLGGRAGRVRLRGSDGVVFSSPRARALRDPSNTPGDLRQVLNAVGCTTCKGTAVLAASNGRWKACPDAGPFGWVTSHTFRKTVSTRMEEAGCTPREVADQLGHANPSMTLDVYFGRSVVTSKAATVLARPVRAV